ncbi:MAG: hypothetical protein R2813_14115 [Flavobacteriales bacterium]
MRFTITLLLCLSTLISCAQKGKCYYAALLGTKRVLCSIDLTTGAGDTIGTLDGALFLKIGSTYDQNNDYYIIGTQDSGLCVYDVRDASLVANYHVSTEARMLEYDNNTHQCYFVDKVGADMKLVSIDLTNGTTSVIGTIAGVTNWSNVSYSYDEDNQQLIALSNLGITVVDVTDASIVNTYPGGSFYFFEYDLNTKLLHYMRQFGSDYIFSSMDLTDGTVNEIDTVDMPSTVLVDANTFDQRTGEFIMGRINDLIKIDVSDASIIQSFPSGSSTNSLFEAAFCVMDLDAGITSNGEVLTATQNNVTYEWLDCDLNATLAGATSKTYAPTISGSYASSSAVAAVQTPLNALASSLESMSWQQSP